MSQLERDAQYVLCFEAVFGPGGLTLGHLLQALAQFERTLRAANSRWDRKLARQAVFTADELAGEALFERHCARCHPAPLFTDNGFHDNGLGADLTALPGSPERGRERITQRVEDLGKYKTPTLRNLGRSAPYMHDGRFSALAEVIGHYRSGIKSAATLDAGLVRADSLGISLDSEQARQLELFLRTLDDLTDAPNHTNEYATHSR